MTTTKSVGVSIRLATLSLRWELREPERKTSIQTPTQTATLYYGWPAEDTDTGDS